MQRLLKISFDQAIMSFTPIISWFILSLLVDKNLINVFSLTYPLQCIYCVIQSIFITGANVSKVKDRNPNATMSGLVIGIVASFLAYGLALTHIDDYISFMNMDPATYRTFAIYSIIILAAQTVLEFILGKLYYENRNSQANRYSVTFNLLNFGVLIGMAIISKNQFVIVGVTSIIMILYATLILAKNCDKFRFKLSLINCIRYDSSTLVSSTLAFFIQLFGLSHAFEYGPEYSLAITFTTLITDTQWDILDSVRTLAYINISQHTFNIKQSLRDAYKLLFLLFSSSVAMFLCLHQFYNLDLGLTLFYLGLGFIDFTLSPRYYLDTAFLQLNWSPSKVTVNKFIARFSRFALTFLPTPFCNDIGAIFASVYQVITTRYLLNKHFTISKSGKIRKRRTKKSALPAYNYNVIPTDEE